MAYLCFHNPRHALERVNEKFELAPIPERCFSTPSHSMHWSDSVIRFDLGLIEQEINNMQRFRRTSVVIADFAMPAIDGLSLLTSIRDPSVKTVLMSGAGDEKLALEAFNDGLIDRYIPKNRRTTLDMVVDYAQELQREYFLEQQRAIQESLSLNPPDLLEDPVVSKYFAELSKKYTDSSNTILSEIRPVSYSLPRKGRCIVSSCSATQRSPNRWNTPRATTRLPMSSQRSRPARASASSTNSLKTTATNHIRGETFSTYRHDSATTRCGGLR